jgi:hypothetical protein
MRRILVVAAALAAVPAFGQGLGVTPAVPESSALTVTPQAGPWMICAASFCDRPLDGQRDEPPARARAEELAMEIRGRYNLPAYVFNRTGEERRLEEERVARIKEERLKQLAAAGLPTDTRIHVKTVRIEDQFAVLVGGYKDDAIARKELDRIRKLKPSEKHMATRVVPDAKGQMHEETVNPFQSAFVCRNPMIPVEKAKTDVDEGKRLKEWNAHESYSLLKCRKAYTLVVKEFRGAATVQTQHESPAAGWLSSHKTSDILNGNEKAAHMLAEFLSNKQLGFEAYVLHTEFNDYVTVGAFDSPDDPRLIQTAQYYMRELNRPNSGVNQLHLQMNLLAEPRPMAVPQIK